MITTHHVMFGIIITNDEFKKLIQSTSIKVIRVDETTLCIGSEIGVNVTPVDCVVYDDLRYNTVISVSRLLGVEPQTLDFRIWSFITTD